jgi:hypothetical protein
VQEAYNREHGIEPRTIVKEIHDINDRLRAMGAASSVDPDQAAMDRAFSAADRTQVEALVTRLEASMRAAARELEFERAAAIRDEIQQIRLRVLEEDASLSVGLAVERAAAGGSSAGSGDGRTAQEKGGQGSGGGPRGRERAARSGGKARGRSSRSPDRGQVGSGDGTKGAPAFLHVISVEVRPAAEEPLVGEPSDAGVDGGAVADAGTAADWLPGIRDEHDEPSGRGGVGERQTWDRSVTPNVIRRTGQRPGRRRRG